MLYQKTLRLLIAFALLAPAAALAQNEAKPPVPDVARLRAHVEYLASDGLEGRRTGTAGAAEAARYVAREFMRQRLLPGGNTDSDELNEQSYLQEFPYVAGVELGRGNSLTATRRVDATTQGAPMAIDFRVGEDWMPLGFGSTGKAEAPAVFVGNGVTAAEQGRDDYKGADVGGKIALAFAAAPDGDNPHSRVTRAGEPRFKAAAARAAGAKALVLIAAEDDFKNDKLSRLRYDNAGGDAGLPVAVISRQAAAKILGLSDARLVAEFEKSLRAKGGAGGQPGADAGSQPVMVWPAAGPAGGVVLSVATDVVRKNVPAANVVGILEGSDPKLRSEVIVVGAHYDHLGRGGEGSLAGREGEVHHGADDNASGVAGLLELARLFSQERGKMRRTVVFVAFGGEEEGLLGSGYYVQNPARPLGQTVAMFNMDMIGRLREDALSVGGVGTAAEWRAIIEEANKGYRVTLDPSLTGGAAEAGAPPEGASREKEIALGGHKEGQTATHVPVKAQGPAPIVVVGANGRAAVTAVPADRFALRLAEDGYGPSDHSSFYARRVPVLFFFTGAHEDYHKPSDTAERVNYEGEARVVQFVRDLVGRVQERDERPTYAVAKSESSARSTGFRVSLGTVPSYGESSDGLKLDAVREGSPAAAAGLRAGDKVVRLAGRDVRNVYDYTQALSAMEPGREYEVEVVREGRRLSMKITPAARK